MSLLEPVSCIFSPKWLFFTKPNQKRIKICRNRLVNFLSLKSLKLIIFRVEMSWMTRFCPKNWFGIELYRYFFRSLLYILKMLFFSFNPKKLSQKIKNLKHSEDFNWIQSWTLHTAKSRVKFDAFSQNIYYPDLILMIKQTFS